MHRVPGFAVWQHLRESFWFLPAVMCVFAAALAELLVWLGGATGRLDLGPLNPVIYRAGAEGSRAVLGAIASSMLTVAGTTFSITIAVLALTSSTYGPRLVRNFLADRGNQLTLGVFVATFLYALLVLRSIRQTSLDDRVEESFVPHLAVNVAVLLALVAVGVLVWFIHHISDSIQVWTLARRVRGELRDTVDHLYPEMAGRGRAEVEPDRDQRPRGPGSQVRAPASGYVVEIDEKRLLKLASRCDAVVTFTVWPGVYVLRGSVMATVHAGDTVDHDLLSSVQHSVAIQESRSPYQDIEFAVDQMLELAVRALSPSMNDPYTAINALDDLSAELARLVGRDTPSQERYDSSGTLRLLTPGVDRGDLIDLTFDTVRTYALQHPMVLHRTLEVAARLGAATTDAALRGSLSRHVHLLVEAYEGSGPQQVDVAALRERADGVRAGLTA